MSVGAWPCAALSLTLLAACAEAPRGAEPSAPRAGVQLALLPPSAESDAAASGGVLTIDGRCLYAVAPNGRRMLLAFMTSKTRWDGDVLRVGDRSFPPGRTVSLGGSEYTGPRSALPWVAPPDPSCDATHIWLTGSID